MKIMFVCMGNICRSPSAEAILKRKAEETGMDLYVESSGIGDWHEGKLADPRTREAASKRGYIISCRAQKILPRHLDEFDYILAADAPVLHHLLKHATPEQKAKISLITEFSSAFKGEEIPDPYYGGEAGFEHVLDMLEDACDGLINHLRQGGKVD